MASPDVLVRRNVDFAAHRFTPGLRRLMIIGFVCHVDTGLISRV